MDNLFFSYTYGFDFVLRLKQEGGWDRINQAYKDFPISTEQIIHPEKYLGARDLPTLIDLSQLPETFIGWQELERNTLGELNISILVDSYLPSGKARRASAGWDGDRFMLYEHNDSGILFLVWYSTWDTREEAREFFQTYAEVLHKRYNKNDPVKEFQIPATQTSQKWHHRDGEAYLEIRGTDVLFLDGLPDFMLEEAIEQYWKSDTREMRSGFTE